MAFLLALALAVAACGGNDGDGGGAGATDGGGTSQAPASPGGSPAGGGDVSGELTVWAMGNEGALLGTMADLFEEENPEVNVSVTPGSRPRSVAARPPTSARWAPT
jgi:multiple sugar transport system substrate-binding protein